MSSRLGSGMSRNSALLGVPGVTVMAFIRAPLTTGTANSQPPISDRYRSSSVGGSPAAATRQARPRNVRRAPADKEDVVPNVSFSNLVAVTAVAFAAPLLLGLFPKVRLPAVVLEIVVGIAIGPSGLGWVKPDLPVQV